MDSYVRSKWPKVLLQFSPIKGFFIWQQFWEGVGKEDSTTCALSSLLFWAWVSELRSCGASELSAPGLVGGEHHWTKLSAVGNMYCQLHTVGSVPYCVYLELWEKMQRIVCLPKRTLWGDSDYFEFRLRSLDDFRSKYLSNIETLQNFLNELFQWSVFHYIESEREMDLDWENSGRSQSHSVPICLLFA